jgi:hypothetical protein
LVVRTDGIGTFVGFVNNPRGGIILTLRVGADGRFRIPGELIRPQPATGVAAPILFTLAGAIDGADRVFGSLEGLGLTLSGEKEIFSTETAAYSGIYQATGTNGSTTILVVGSARQMMALIIFPTTSVVPLGSGFRARVPGIPPVAALTSGPSNVDGGLGSAGSDGSLLVRTPNNTTLVGRVNPITDTATGTVAPSTDPLFLFSGPETEGLGPPIIVNTPAAQTAPYNSRVTFTIEVAGKTPFTFQWRKDGVEIAAATTATYAIAAAQGAHEGSYSCDVSNSEGNTTSVPMQLTVAAPTARLVNLSISTQLTSAAEGFTLGYVVSGDDSSPAKPLLIRAAGPSLAALGVSNPASDPKIEILAAGLKTAENDDWGGSASLAAAMAGVAAFPFAGPTSKDAAILTNVTTSNNMVEVSATGPGTVVAELYDTAAFDPGRRILNISVRKPIGSRLTAGFVIGGTGRKTVLVRAVGPGLAAFGVGDAIADPQLVLTGKTITSGNDNWGGTSELVAAFRAAGAFELGAASRDAALVATLEPGDYTVEVTSVNSANGTCLIEIYDLDR